MPNRIEYRAFDNLYESLAYKLITPVSIVPLLTADRKLYDIPVHVDAFWDTGSTISCIKPGLYDRLKLRPIKGREAILSGIGGDTPASLTLVSIRPTDNLEIEGCPVYVADFPADADVLIGMNIITLGDFAVCNAGGKTSVSFALPPFPDRINFADKADAVNKQNNA
jgi:hypothetical protein